MFTLDKQSDRDDFAGHLHMMWLLTVVHVHSNDLNANLGLDGSAMTSLQGPSAGKKSSIAGPSCVLSLVFERFSGLSVQASPKTSNCG